jgi:hypothetical protein
MLAAQNHWSGSRRCTLVGGCQLNQLDRLDVRVVEQNASEPLGSQPPRCRTEMFQVRG